LTPRAFGGILHPINDGLSPRNTYNVAVSPPNAYIVKVGLPGVRRRCRPSTLPSVDTGVRRHCRSSTPA
jgi:hypothetical protein